MNTRGKMAIGILVIGLLVLIVPESAIAQVQVKVKCDKGQSVQAALDSLTGPATLIVTGICKENIVITKDDVTLQGGSYEPADSTRHTIWVNGAQRVSMIGVTITRGRNGISVYQGGSLTLDGTPAGNASISGATYNGVVAVHGSSVTVNRSTIQGNLQGVTATDNSSLSLTNSTITANRSAGVLVQRSSSARIGQSFLGVSGPNEITNNEGNGVNVSRSSYALVDGNTITGNSGSGIFIDGASCTVTSNMISSNKSWAGVNVLASNVRIGVTEGPQYAGNMISDNYGNGIFINSGSSAYIGGNTIKGNGTALNPSHGTYGIFLVNSIAALLGGNEITENNGSGVYAWGSRVRIGDPYTGMSSHNTISGNGTGSSTTIPKGGVYGYWGTSLAITDAEINDNTGDGIKMSACSNVLFPGGSTPVIVTGNTLFGLQCSDANFCSRFGGNTRGISGNTGGDVSLNCTGF